jgi:hypothetical protein
MIESSDFRTKRMPLNHGDGHRAERVGERRNAALVGCEDYAPSRFFNKLLIIMPCCFEMLLQGSPREDVGDTILFDLLNILSTGIVLLLQCLHGFFQTVER